jgi:predicted ATPase
MNAARIGLRPSAVALTQSGLVVARAGRRTRGADGHRDNPAQPRTLAQLALFPAVQLFAPRAARVMPGFALTEVDMAAVMGIDSDDDRR